MEENNRLIAEFMGFDYCPSGSIISDIEFYNGFDALNFHTSFDWLMPVVATIEQLPEAYETEEFLLIRDELCTGRIDTVYEAIVNYIKWHNSQNK